MCVCVCVWPRSETANNELTEIFAKAGLLVAAEGRGNVGLVVGVDEDGSRQQTVGHLQGFADVRREDAGRQAVLRRVGTPQYSIDVADNHTHTHHCFILFTAAWCNPHC